MRITEIVVSDFRGFAGPARYDFTFGGANNLFVYGENGSGKSSLFRAVQEFFNQQKAARPFADFKNDRDPTLTSGTVTLRCDDGTEQSWSFGGERPVKDLPASQIALRLGCLDYRSLLETNFTQRGPRVNLFKIAVGHLVGNLERPVQGGSKRVGELWDAVERTNPANHGHYARYLQQSRGNLKRFNDAFEPVIKPLIDKATELLQKFPNGDLILGAAFQPVDYDETARKFIKTELLLSVRRGGTEVTEHHNILNEARLSAIGLVIYLAGLLTSVPASIYPKLLVLDDVLVGLDMANRMPVLNILAEYFADWQIILMTHDQVWYEMVMMDTPPNRWSAYELWLADDGVTPMHRSWRCDTNFFIQRAKRHLAENDQRAAGMYARAAFEMKVKAFCENHQVPVPFVREIRKLNIEKAWEAAKTKAVAKAGNSPKKASLEASFLTVDLVKKVVLNPLSHSIPQPLTKTEVQGAIDAVETLSFA